MTVTVTVTVNGDGDGDDDDDSICAVCRGSCSVTLTLYSTSGRCSVLARAACTPDNR